MTKREDGAKPDADKGFDASFKHDDRRVFFVQMTSKIHPTWRYRLELRAPEASSTMHALARVVVSVYVDAVKLTTRLQRLLKLRRQSASATARAARERAAPPLLAELLYLLLVPRKSADGQLGDFREFYDRDLEQYGARRANLNFWANVLHSAGPAIWAKAKSIGLWAIVVDWSRRKIGL